MSTDTYAGGGIALPVYGSVFSQTGLYEPDPVGRELIFIDTSVNQIDELIHGLRSNAQIVVLDANTNGIEQVSAVLSDFQDLSAVHFFTHGDDASINLGSTKLNTRTLAKYSDQIADWGDSLQAPGDMLFYGCNVASTSEGRWLIKDLSGLTRADVAASDNLTGAASLGGDWELEVSKGRGEITTELAVTDDIYEIYDSVLQDELLFSSNFEQGLSGAKVDSKTSHGVTVVNDPLGGSNRVVRFELREDDPVSNNKTRAELRPRPTKPTRFGQNYTYSFRMFLPNDYGDDGSWDILAQWHGVPDKNLGESYRSPPAALTTLNGEQFINHRWDASNVTRTQNTGSYGQTKSWNGSYNLGRWVDWKFQIKWSSGNDGVFKAYKDGQLVSARQGPNTFNDKFAPYFKIGIYKADFSQNPGKSDVSRRVLYFDDVKIIEGEEVEITGDEQVYQEPGGSVDEGGEATSNPVPPLAPIDTFQKVIPRIDGYFYPEVDEAAIDEVAADYDGDDAVRTPSSTPVPTTEGEQPLIVRDYYGPRLPEVSQKRTVVLPSISLLS